MVLKLQQLLSMGISNNCPLTELLKLF